MDPMNFEFDPTLLVGFIAVADCGSILRASRALNLSQPALTAQMRRLEADLGATLLRRSVKGAELTAAGHRLLEHARRIRAALSAAAADLSKAGEIRGRLCVHASTTAGGHIVPRLFAGFRRIHPHLALQLKVGNTGDVIRAIRAGAETLGMVEGTAKAPNVRLEPYVMDELVLTAAPGPAELAPVSAAALMRLPLLWREQGSGTRAVVERALRRAGRRRADDAAGLELGSTEAIKTAVAAGLGMAFLSRWSIQNELQLGKLRIVPVPGLRVERPFSWVLASGAPAPAARLFYEFAQKNRPLLRA